MASEHTITHFPLLPQHSYNSPNLPGLLPKSSQGSLGPTELLSLLFPVKYGLTDEGGEDTRVCGETPDDELHKTPHTKAQNIQVQTENRTHTLALVAGAC